MSDAVVSGSINNFSAGCAPKITILDELEGIWGRLDSITESGDMILADIEGTSIELPKSLSSILEPLVGQQVVVGLFDGEYCAGRCSA
jgi:hypothetical protein